MDILARLRSAAWAGPVPCPVCEEAADEIARLRAEIDNIKQFEFPRRVDKVADVWRNKCDLAESEIARLRDENGKLLGLLGACRDNLGGHWGDTELSVESVGCPDAVPARVKEAFDSLRDENAKLREDADEHDSDCATHNEPAYPNGPCDCSLAMQKGE